MKPSRLTLAMALIVASLPMPAVTQAAPAAAGDPKVVLTVTYVYESNGASGDKYDSREWQVKRRVYLRSVLARRASSPYPTLHAMEQQQTRTIEKQARDVADLEKKAAPMMKDLQAIVERCGDDEKCMQQAVGQYTATPSANAQIGSIRKDAQPFMSGAAPRYEIWQSTSLAGDYRITERSSSKNADPICAQRPNQRCRRSESRDGEGTLVPPADGRKNSAEATGLAQIEIDTQEKSMAILLPVPTRGLDYVEAVQSDHPLQKSGSTPRQLVFRGLGSKPVLVGMQGDWRNQKGEISVPMKNDNGDAGTLSVQWQLSPQ